MLNGSPGAPAAGHCAHRTISKTVQRDYVALNDVRSINALMIADKVIQALGRTRA